MSERLDLVNYHEYNFNFQSLHLTKNFQIHPYLAIKSTDSKENKGFGKPNPLANDFKKNPFQLCDLITEKTRQDKPEVSIIILNYNQSELTLKCVASILEVENTMRFEIIVVDNGSHINQEREVWTIDLNPGASDFPKRIPSPQLKSLERPDTFIFPMQNRFMIIDDIGRLLSMDFSEDGQLGERVRLWGTPIGMDNGSIKVIAVMPAEETIMLLNNNGEVWAVDLTYKEGEYYTHHYLMNGDKGASVGVYGEPARHFLYHNDRVLVVNQKGEVWSHSIIRH